MLTPKHKVMFKKQIIINHVGYRAINMLIKAEVERNLNNVPLSKEIKTF
jgi:hypothetical protein